MTRSGAGHGRRRLPATLSDVAELAGVSRQTVSNAMNNPDLLRADTLERVQAPSTELGYSPNRAARNLRTRSSPPDRAPVRARRRRARPTRLMDRFVHSLVEASSAAGYHVLLFPGDGEDPLAGYDDLLRSTAVDAFVATDTYLGNPQAAWLETRRAPFVAFGRPWDDAERRPPVGRRRRCGRHRAGHRSPARPGPHPDRLDRLAQGVTDRRGPPRRLGRAMHGRGLPTTGLASRVEDTVRSGSEAAAVLLDEARRPASSAPPTPSRIGRAAHP